MIGHIEKTDFENIMICKTHETNLDVLIKRYSEKYNVVLICSERKGKGLLFHEKYRSYENVVIFDYDELNETEENTLDKIVNNIYERVKPVLPENTELDKKKCKNRIEKMNERYEEIKHKPFSYIDHYYELHGHHRYRRRHQ